MKVQWRLKENFRLPPTQEQAFKASSMETSHLALNSQNSWSLQRRPPLLTRLGGSFSPPPLGRGWEKPMKTWLLPSVFIWAVAKILLSSLSETIMRRRHHETLIITKVAGIIAQMSNAQAHAAASTMRPQTNNSNSNIGVTWWTKWISLIAISR